MASVETSTIIRIPFVLPGNDGDDDRGPIRILSVAFDERFKERPGDFHIMVRRDSIDRLVVRQDKRLAAVGDDADNVLGMPMAELREDGLGFVLEGHGDGEGRARGQGQGHGQGQDQRLVRENEADDWLRRLGRWADRAIRAARLTQGDDAENGPDNMWRVVLARFLLLVSVIALPHLLQFLAWMLDQVAGNIMTIFWSLLGYRFVLFGGFGL